MNYKGKKRKLVPQECHHKNVNSSVIKRQILTEISKEVAIMSIAIPFLTKEQIHLRVLNKLGLKNVNITGKVRIVKTNNQRLDYKNLSVYIPQSTGSLVEEAPRGRKASCLESPRHLRQKLLGRSKPMQIIEQAAAISSTQESKISYEYSTPSPIQVATKFKHAKPPREPSSKKKTPKRRLFSLRAEDVDWRLEKESAKNTEDSHIAEDSDSLTRRRLSAGDKNTVHETTPTSRAEYERMHQNTITKPRRLTCTSRRCGSSSDRPNTKLRYEFKTVDGSNKRVSNKKSLVTAIAQTNEGFQMTAGAENSENEIPAETNLQAVTPIKNRGFTSIPLSTRYSDGESNDTSAVSEVISPQEASKPVAADYGGSQQTPHLANTDANFDVPVRSSDEKRTVWKNKLSRLSLNYRDKSTVISVDARRESTQATINHTMRLQTTTKNGGDSVEDLSQASRNVQIFSDMENNKYTSPPKTQAENDSPSETSNSDVGVTDSSLPPRSHGGQNSGEPCAEIEIVDIQSEEHPANNTVYVSQNNEKCRSPKENRQINEESDEDDERSLAEDQKSSGSQTCTGVEDVDSTPPERLAENMFNASNVDGETAHCSGSGLCADEETTTTTNQPSKITSPEATSPLLGSAMTTFLRLLRSRSEVEAQERTADTPEETAAQAEIHSDKARPTKLLSSVQSEESVLSRRSSPMTPPDSGSPTVPSDPEGARANRVSPPFQIITSSAVSRGTSAHISTSGSSQFSSVISSSLRHKDSPLSRKCLRGRSTTKTPPSSRSASDGSTNATVQSSSLTVLSRKTVTSRGSSDYISSVSTYLSLNASFKNSQDSSQSMTSQPKEGKSCDSRNDASASINDTPTSSYQSSAHVRKKGLPMILHLAPGRTLPAGRVLFADDEDPDSLESPVKSVETTTDQDAGVEGPDEEQASSEATTNDEHQTRILSLLQTRFSNQLKQQESSTLARLTAESRPQIDSFKRQMSSSPTVLVSPVLLRKGADKLDGLPFDSGEAVRPATTNWLHRKRDATRTESPYNSFVSSFQSKTFPSSLHIGTTAMSQSQQSSLILNPLESVPPTALVDIPQRPPIAALSLTETTKFGSHSETEVSSGHGNMQTRQMNEGSKRHQGKIKRTQRNLRPIEKLTIMRNLSLHTRKKVVLKRLKSVRPIEKLIITRSDAKRKPRSDSSPKKSPESVSYSNESSKSRSLKRSNSSAKWWMEDDVLKGLSELTSTGKNQRGNQGLSQFVTRSSVNRSLR